MVAGAGLAAVPGALLLPELPVCQLGDRPARVRALGGLRMGASHPLSGVDHRSVLVDRSPLCDVPVPLHYTGTQDARAEAGGCAVHIRGWISAVPPALFLHCAAHRRIVRRALFDAVPGGSTV